MKTARLSQHFLTDQGALDDIVHAAAIRTGDAVLEIGPGRGALTGPLSASMASLPSGSCRWPSQSIKKM